MPVTVTRQITNVTVTKQVSQLSVTSPGPQGPPGPAGAGADALTLTAGASVIAYRPIAVDASGQAVPADPTDAAQIGALVGIATNSASGGQAVNLSRAGEVTNGGWSWTPGQTLWAALDGGIVSSPPAGAAWWQQLGIALSATKMLVTIEPPIKAA